MEYDPGSLTAPTWDPYDPWATRVGVAARGAYYARRASGFTAAGAIAATDLLAPNLLRRLFGLERRRYPIVAALTLLVADRLDRPLPDDARQALDALALRDDPRPGACAWGLGFSWMSKNGLYGPRTPFVTHTPYAMEALLVCADRGLRREAALEMFDATWHFLEGLAESYDERGELALSYAPRPEPRVVVNACAYAAYAYALHAVRGRPERRARAAERSAALMRYVRARQAEDGSWSYYADALSGNFIDGFHSCFVLKNLRKARALLGDEVPEVSETLDRGARFIERRLIDPRSGLCRRFSGAAGPRAFHWDLYDQAEYLGLLVDEGRLADAATFGDRVRATFDRGGRWACRIDCFGRRWGRDFLRWGIVPFAYHEARRRWVERSGGAGHVRDRG